MENKKNLPIKLFAKRNKIDERKTEGGGSSDLPSWAQLSAEQFTERLNELKTGITAVEQQLDRRVPERSFIPGVVKVKIHEKAVANLIDQRLPPYSIKIMKET
jgi:hypothetical protein